MPSFSRYSDPSINTFKKTNMYYESDPFIRYQDPAYIGFKLFFLFDQPGSGLLSEQPLKNTAMGYLERIGDTTRAEYLKRFVNLLKNINSKSPWFFQQIDGLDEAWKHMYNEKEFKPILSDRKIIINCLDESIDLRMTALMDLYRKACYDWPNRREVIPKNLRRFKVKIYCYESRTLNKWGFPWSPAALGVSGAVEAALPPIVKQGKNEMDKWFGADDSTSAFSLANMFSRKEDSINDNISRILFDFNYCEWLPDESNTLFASMSNKELTLKAQKLAFSYENVEEDNLYRFFHDKKVTDSIIDIIDGLALDTPSLLDALPAYLTPYLNGAIGKAVTALRNKLIGGVNDLLMGNVYGFTPLAAAQAIVNGGVSGLLSVAKQAGNNKSMKNDDGDAPGLSLGNNSSGASLTNNKNSTPAKSQEHVDVNKSLTNDNGPDAGKPNPFIAKVFFDDFHNKSLNNDKNSNPATAQTPANPIASLKNDNGPDATSQGASPQVSQVNDKNSKPATYQGKPIDNTSLTNDKNSNPATSQGSVTVDASLNNDNGPDATYQGASPQISQSNDKNSNPATSQGSVTVDASLTNVKNSNPATSQGSVTVDASLSNIKGSNPATSQTPANSRASLSNDDGPDATSQGKGPENPSLNNINN